MSYAVMLMLIALAAAGGNIIKPPTASGNEITELRISCQRQVPQQFIWLAMGCILYCLGVIVASAGAAVAISMAIGLATAPLFRAFLAFDTSKNEHTAHAMPSSVAAEPRSASE